MLSLYSALENVMQLFSANKNSFQYQYLCHVSLEFWRQFLLNISANKSHQKLSKKCFDEFLFCRSKGCSCVRLRIGLILFFRQNNCSIFSLHSVCGFQCGPDYIFNLSILACGICIPLAQWKLDYWLKFEKISFALAHHLRNTERRNCQYIAQCTELSNNSKKSRFDPNIYIASTFSHMSMFLKCSHFRSCSSSIWFFVCLFCRSRINYGNMFARFWPLSRHWRRQKVNFSEIVTTRPTLSFSHYFVLTRYEIHAAPFKREMDPSFSK